MAITTGNLRMDMAAASALNILYVSWACYGRKDPKKRKEPKDMQAALLAKEEKDETSSKGNDFHWKQLFYVPNILDYFRVYFLWLAVHDVGFFTAPGVNFAISYSFSYFLDAFDGMAARALHQTSHLGYYLDMVIDRMSSILCLYICSTVLLSHQLTIIPAAFELPLVGLCYFFIIFVEILAHGVVVYYSEVLGIHQKKMGHVYGIVRLYLDSPAMLFYGCAMFELCVLGVIAHQPLCVLVGFPGLLFRAVANLARLYACVAMEKDKGH